MQLGLFRVNSPFCNKAPQLLALFGNNVGAIRSPKHTSVFTDEPENVGPNC